MSIMTISFQDKGVKSKAWVTGSGGWPNYLLEGGVEYPAPRGTLRGRDREMVYAPQDEILGRVVAYVVKRRIKVREEERKKKDKGENNGG